MINNFSFPSCHKSMKIIGRDMWLRDQIKFKDIKVKAEEQFNYTFGARLKYCRIPEFIANHLIFMCLVRKVTYDQSYNILKNRYL